MISRIDLEKLMEARSWLDKCRDDLNTTGTMVELRDAMREAELAQADYEAVLRGFQAKYPITP